MNFRTLEVGRTIGGHRLRRTSLLGRSRRLRLRDRRHLQESGPTSCDARSESQPPTSRCKPKSKKSAFLKKEISSNLALPLSQSQFDYHIYAGHGRAHEHRQRRSIARKRSRWSRQPRNAARRHGRGENSKHKDLIQHVRPKSSKFFNNRLECDAT